MNYNIQIEPVTTNQRQVIRLLMRYIPSGGEEEAMRLAGEGGIIDQSLNRMAAERLANQLRELDVRVRVVPVEEHESGKVFRVRVVDLGERFMDVINEIRAITRFSPEEARHVVRNADVVGEYDNREDAERVKENLEAAGATVEIEAVGDDEPMSTHLEDTDYFVVHGQILSDNGEPVQGLRIRAFNLDLRSEEFLGEDFTGAKGEYLIEYSAQDIKHAEAGGADLVVRVYSKTGQVIEADVTNQELTKVGGESILFNASGEEEISLKIASELAELSQYEEVSITIEPLLDEVTTWELTSEDVLFLHHKSGKAIHKIAFLADDARIARETGMPESVFFGLAMLDIGVVEGDAETLPSIKLPVVVEEPLETLISHLEKALEERIIPIVLRNEMDVVQRLFEQIK